jgi:hypothetical protein
MIFEARVAEMPLHWRCLLCFFEAKTLEYTNLIEGVSAFRRPDAPEELEVDVMGP